MSEMKKGDTLQRIAELLGVEPQTLRGVELPGLGHFHALSHDPDEGTIVWYHDAGRSTQAVRAPELVMMLQVCRENMRVKTIASANLAALTVDTSAEVEGPMETDAESHIDEKARTARSRTRSRPAAAMSWSFAEEAKITEEE